MTYFTELFLIVTYFIFIILGLALVSMILRKFGKSPPEYADDDWLVDWIYKNKTYIKPQQILLKIK